MALRDTITPVPPNLKRSDEALIMIKHKRWIAIVVFLPSLLMAQGSATEGAARPEPLVLSLKQAIQLALGPGGNTTAQVAEQSVRLAEAQSAQARAALRPAV